ncbi:hypothetical protein ACFPN7_41650 [Amycolatopsis halotolerans]|uniref:hypothetical protein n=1 Tax=Amycolatopsis halotolerans TaxID=330083 RepID=UPI003612E7BA
MACDIQPNTVSTGPGTRPGRRNSREISGGVRMRADPFGPARSRSARLSGIRTGPGAATTLRRRRNGAVSLVPGVDPPSAYPDPAGADPRRFPLSELGV